MNLNINKTVIVNQKELKTKKNLNNTRKQKSRYFYTNFNVN